MANVKTKLVTLEAQKTHFLLQLYYNLQSSNYKVNSKNAMGFSRNNNEEIGKIRNSTLIFLQGALNGGVAGSIVPIVESGTSNVRVESQKSS